MAAEVALALERREIAGRTVTLKVRYDDFTTITRSRTLLAPTAAAATIGRCARDLLDRTEAARRPVRLLGVTASNLVNGGEGQMGLFEE
jgi:DNA polymerase-4